MKQEGYSDGKLLNFQVNQHININDSWIIKFQYPQSQFSMPLIEILPICPYLFLLIPADKIKKMEVMREENCYPELIGVNRLMRPKASLGLNIGLAIFASGLLQGIALGEQGACPV
ncbi:hypothetical protein M422DRAFT_56664 [Sphaerobolus stellatus SS14]|uniref:Uncharacterized protein n=1 Tax=Sphaerobolus stellatus (strain SS14) TaxID=990650 RepID=A0A0C9T4T8_SPHS4|nr:hypothetical protein M422DRAFT_56664 [Sphaerobolus stellatus SS14]